MKRSGVSAVVTIPNVTHPSDATVRLRSPIADCDAVRLNPPFLLTDESEELVASSSVTRRNVINVLGHW